MNPLDRFSATVAYDPESSGYVAVCDEIPGISAFGVTRAEALSEFEVVLAMAVETYAEEGWPLPEPNRPSDPELPSGEFRVRIPRYLHGLLAKRSEREGVSQNTLVVALLAEGLAGATRSETPAFATKSVPAPVARTAVEHPTLRPRSGDLNLGTDRTPSPYVSRTARSSSEPDMRPMAN